MFSWPLWNEISSTNGSSRTLISNSSLFFCVEMISRSANLIRWSLSAPGFYRVSSVYLDGSMDRWRDWSIHREECAVWHSRSRRIGMLPSLSTFVFFFSCVCVCVCVWVGSFCVAIFSFLWLWTCCFCFTATAASWRRAGAITSNNGATQSIFLSPTYSTDSSFSLSLSLFQTLTHSVPQRERLPNSVKLIWLTKSHKKIP